MSQPPCVVFDLDGTLLASDSFTRFLAHRLRRSPVRLVLVAVTAPALLVLGVRPVRRLQAERLVIWAATVGLGPVRFDALLRDFAVEHAGAPGGRRITVVLQRLQSHREAGDRVMVATACAEPLAREVCHVLDLHGVEILASSFTAHRWRLPRGVPARGQLKVQALQDAGIELPVDHAYSDSLLDLPLLRAARTAHLVRPSRRHLTLLLRELGPHVEVIR